MIAHTRNESAKGTDIRYLSIFTQQYRFEGDTTLLVNKHLLFTRNSYMFRPLYIRS